MTPATPFFTRPTRRWLVATALFALPVEAAAQAKPIGPHCAAVSCEAGTIYVVAIDSLSRRFGDSLPPRVLSTVCTAPFLPLRGGRPAPAGQFDLIAFGMLTRSVPGARVVDSASVVRRDRTLTPGGALFVVSPLDWMGEDLVRLEIARYPTHWDIGEQYFIVCERGPTGWRVRRIDTGWQN